MKILQSLWSRFPISIGTAMCAMAVFLGFLVPVRFSGKSGTSTAPPLSLSLDVEDATGWNHEEEYAHPSKPRKRKRVLIRRELIPWKVSAYTPHCDKGWKRFKLFAGGNFLRGGRWYDPDKPYPEGPPDDRGQRKSRQYMWQSWQIQEKVVALPTALRKYTHERIPLGDGTWGHRWIIFVPGYGYAVPRDTITQHNRIDCLYYEQPATALKRGVKKKKCVLYERIWVDG